MLRKVYDAALRAAYFPDQSVSYSYYRCLAIGELVEIGSVYYLLHPWLRTMGQRGGARSLLKQYLYLLAYIFLSLDDENYTGKHDA
jgi:hypothetical protein